MQNKLSFYTLVEPIVKIRLYTRWWLFSIVFVLIWPKLDKMTIIWRIFLWKQYYEKWTYKSNYQTLSSAMLFPLHMSYHFFLCMDSDMLLLLIEVLLSVTVNRFVFLQESNPFYFNQSVSKWQQVMCVYMRNMKDVLLDSLDNLSQDYR